MKSYSKQLQSHTIPAIYNILLGILISQDFVCVFSI